MLSKLLSSKWVIFCLLALVVFIVFGRAVWFDYVQLDEGILLVNNKFFISDISNIFEAFKHDINYPSNISPYYRPIFIVSFILNSQFDSSPAVFYFGNILLHITAVYIVFLFFKELGFRKEVSFFSALLFAIHPAVTPVVVWVPGRIEAILAIFTILSLVMFIRFIKTADWRYLFGFFGSFIIALLTKETVLGLIPILIFYYLTQRKEKERKISIILLSGLAAIIAVWFFVRKSVLLGANVSDVSFWQILVTLWSNSVAFILYLGKAILPFNLSVLPALGGISMLFYGFLALLIILAVSWLIGKTKGNRTLLFPFDVRILGLLWFVVFLAPSLVGFYPTERMIFFEHRLYLPLVGIFIFFAGLMSGYSMSRYRRLLPVGIAVLFLFLSFNYSDSYRGRLVFWEKAVADSPQVPQSHKGLATAYLADDKLEDAKEEFEEAIRLNPNERGVHLILGLYLADLGQYDEAGEELKKEIEIDPNQFIAYHSLGRISAFERNLGKAEEYFLKTLEINPDYILAYQDLAVLYFSQNKHPQAVVQIKELLKRQTVESLHPQIVKIIEIYAKETVLQMGF